MADTQHNIAGDFLTLLKVPHTEYYTQDLVGKMPFPTLFGLQKLLEKYNIKSEGIKLPDKTDITQLPVPFIASMNHGLVIVKQLLGDNVLYLTQGVEETMPLTEFEKAWDGDAFLAFPEPESREPEYSGHARIQFLMKSRKWVFMVCLVGLLAYFFVTSHTYSNLSAIFLTAVNIFGLYISYLLVQKSANIQSAAADRVCGVIQEGGCDKVLATDASKFFGLFGWAEVGFAYFSVSLAAMLMFPSTIPSLALLNLCCLPFSFWSVWYQKFRAKHWCTLCLSVQGSLWLLFAAYLCGGWIKAAFPVRFDILVLAAAYVAVTLGANAIVEQLSKANQK